MEAREEKAAAPSIISPKLGTFPHQDNALTQTRSQREPGAEEGGLARQVRKGNGGRRDGGQQERCSRTGMQQRARTPVRK